MRLSTLDPHWVGEWGRHGAAVSFQCPCCTGTERATRLVVPFRNPIDGGAPMEGLNSRGIFWGREGSTFDTLTLTPSVDASGIGHWHGWVRAGEVV